MSVLSTQILYFSLNEYPNAFLSLRFTMSGGRRRQGWRKNAIVTGVILSPIAVLALIFWLLALGYQSELSRGEGVDQPRTLP